MTATPALIPGRLSGDGPMEAEELRALRACLHDEMTLDGGADPAVHGLYDYYETTKSLMDTVAARDEEIAKLRAFVHDRYVALDAADGKYGYRSFCGICRAAGEPDVEPPHKAHCILASAISELVADGETR